MRSRACCAHALSLAGQLAAASRDFAAADALERKNHPKNASQATVMNQMVRLPPSRIRQRFDVMSIRHWRERLLAQWSAP